MKLVRILASATLIFVILWACQQQLQGPDGEPTTEQAVIVETNALLQSWREQIAVLEAKPDLSAQEQGKLAELKAKLNTIQGYVDQATSPEGGIDAVGAVSGGAMLLPFPWNIIGSVGAGGLAMWLRDRRKRKSFDALVNAINQVKGKNTRFADALDAAGLELRAELPSTAMAEIDRVRSGKKSIVRDW